MKTTAVVLVTQARFTGTWTIDQRIEPGSVPDRPVPFSRAGKLYRPGRLELVLRAGAAHADPCALRMENGSGPMRAARDGLQLHSATLYGGRLKADGQPGAQGVTEHLYARTAVMPDWVQAAVHDALTALGG
jgi:hypothetical protein